MSRWVSVSACGQYPKGPAFRGLIGPTFKRAILFNHKKQKVKSKKQKAKSKKQKVKSKKVKRI
jgi:hypothetical protein